MKYAFTILIISMLASCTNRDKSKNEEPAIEPSAGVKPADIDKKFPELTSFLRSQDPAFSPAIFERQEIETGDTVPDLIIDTAALREYRPFLIYNADSSMAIDPVSYNYVVRKIRDTTMLVEGGPDVEIGLLDFRNNKRKQLFFTGTMGFFLEAKWLDPQTALFALAMEASPNSIRPVIWEYDTRTRKRVVYNYPGAIQASPENYAVQVLNRKQWSKPAAPAE